MARKRIHFGDMLLDKVLEHEGYVLRGEEFDGGPRYEAKKKGQNWTQYFASAKVQVAEEGDSIDKEDLLKVQVTESEDQRVRILLSETCPFLDRDLEFDPRVFVAQEIEWNLSSVAEEDEDSLRETIGGIVHSWIVLGKPGYQGLIDRLHEIMQKRKLWVTLAFDSARDWKSLSVEILGT